MEDVLSILSFISLYWYYVLAIALYPSCILICVYCMKLKAECLFPANSPPENYDRSTYVLCLDEENLLRQLINYCSWNRGSFHSRNRNWWEVLVGRWLMGGERIRKDISRFLLVREQEGQAHWLCMYNSYKTHFAWPPEDTRRISILF